MGGLWGAESCCSVLEKKSCNTSYVYEKLFKKQVRFKLGKIPIATEFPHLSTVCDTTNRFLKHVTCKQNGYVEPKVGVLARYNVTMQDVIDTLEYMADLAEKSPDVLADCSFIDEHFTLYRWYAPDDCYQTRFAPGHCSFPECIRVTHYNVAKMHAQYKKRGAYCFPLYPLPLDEKNKLPQHVRENKTKYKRFMYGLQAILKGALENEKGFSEPLGWVTEKDYRNFLRQGSGILVFPDGTKKRVEIAAHNGMKGDQSYWYSAVVPEVIAHGKRYHKKVRPLPGVSFAGDVENIGFGKLLCVVGINETTGKREAHLGVLMDTGTAFKNNPYHIDLFMGYFDHPLHFGAFSKKFPSSGEVFILIKKKRN